MGVVRESELGTMWVPGIEFGLSALVATLISSLLRFFLIHYFPS